MIINVGLYEMDKRCADRLLTVFQMVYKGQCVVVDNIDEADTVIIDMDGKDVDETWSRFSREHAGKPVVIMSEKPVAVEGTVYVAKPAKLPELLSALKSTSNKEIAADLTLSSSSSQKTADALSKKMSADIARGKIRSSNESGEFALYYEPNKFLQGNIAAAIRRANSIPETVFIKCWSDRWIMVTPNSEFLFLNIKESQLRNMGLVKMGEEIAYSEDKVSDEQIKEMASADIEEVKAVSIEKFLWDMTVRTSRGRIPEGVHIDELYTLTRWPNLTRLAHVHNAMRISAFWLDQPQSIKDVVIKLAINPEDVYTYFSAASEAGLLIPAKRREDKLVKPEVAKSSEKKRGILSAIMRKVSRKVAIDEDAA